MLAAKCDDARRAAVFRFKADDEVSRDQSNCMAPLRQSRRTRVKRSILFVATILFTASVLAQMRFGEGKSGTDAAVACAGISNHDKTSVPSALARPDIDVEEKGDEFLICAQ